MKKYFITAAVLFYTQITVAFDHTHSIWTDTLKIYQNAQGLVNYRQLKNDASKNNNLPFNTYLIELQKVSHKEFEAWSKEQKMAFLINAYNALTIKLIVDNYPVKSIKKIGGVLTKPWDVKFFSLLNGKIKSLDPIEHEWLRPVYKDYRIHAAVNCASVSCPPLRNEAFVAEKLEAQLNEQMTVWLTDISRNMIDINNKKIKLSKIYDWYEKDFKDWGGGVLNSVNKHLPKPIAKAILGEAQIEFMDYDWNLNEIK